MAKHAELTGKKFGLLTVLEATSQRQDGYLVWHCRCDCGREILVNTKHLTRGTVTDCGCVLRSGARHGPAAEDLTGQRFGMLTVEAPAPAQGGRTRWLCRCDCGNTHIVAARNLKAGKVTSCGCKGVGRSMAEDLAGRRFGRLVALYPTTRRDRRGTVCWYCRCDCGTCLEVSRNDLIQGEYRSCGCLQREVQQQIPSKLHHIDGTCIELLEKRKHRSDNTSGFRGVSRDKNGRFRVGIGFKGKRYYVGSYTSYEQAVTARLEAEQTIHEAFVTAYYRWEEQYGDLPEEQRSPLIFDVKKKNGHFCVITDMTDPLQTTG